MNLREPRFVTFPAAIREYLPMPLAAGARHCWRRYRGGGPGAGRDGAPKTRLAAAEFAAKSRHCWRRGPPGPPWAGRRPRAGRRGLYPPPCELVRLDPRHQCLSEVEVGFFAHTALVCLDCTTSPRFTYKPHHLLYKYTRHELRN